MNHKTYIGDSVYAAIDDYGDITLTTENGHHDDPRNIIILDPQLFRNLVTWVEHKLKEGFSPAG